MVGRLWGVGGNLAQARRDLAKGVIISHIHKCIFKKAISLARERVQPVNQSIATCRSPKRRLLSSPDDSRINCIRPYVLKLLLSMRYNLNVDDI